MSYLATVSKDNPLLIVVMVNQSGHMAFVADRLAEKINANFRKLIESCTNNGNVVDAIYLALIAYGNSHLGSSQVGSTFGGNITGADILPIGEVAQNPLRTEQISRMEDDGAGGLIELTVEVPVWLDAVADSNDVPMTEAFSMASAIVQDWIAQYPNSHPPIIHNITASVPPTDGDPRDYAEYIRGLLGKADNPLVSTILLDDNHTTHSYPDDANLLATDNEKVYFGMCSLLPDPWVQLGKSRGQALTMGSRYFTVGTFEPLLPDYIEIDLSAQQPAPPAQKTTSTAPSQQQQPSTSPSPAKSSPPAAQPTPPPSSGSNDDRRDYDFLKGKNNAFGPIEPDDFY